MTMRNYAFVYLIIIIILLFQARISRLDISLSDHFPFLCVLCTSVYGCAHLCLHENTYYNSLM